VLNAALKEMPAEIRLRAGAASPAIRDVVTGQTVAYRQEAGQIVLGQSIPAQEAWVLEIREGSRQ
jgi:hypothetical protein